MKNSKIEEIIRQNINSEIIYHRNYDLFKYFKAVILLFKEIIAFNNDTSKLKLNSLLKDKLSNIKNAS